MLLFSVFVGFFLIKNGLTIKVDLEVGPLVVRQINADYFLSIAIDTSLIRNNWCDIIWGRAVVLARGLSPSYLRLGGDDSDWMIFNDQSTCRYKMHREKTCDMFARTNFTMTALQFMQANWFANYARLPLIFDVNMVPRYPNGSWNPENTLKLLNYSSWMGYEMDFEVGNEPDDYPGWYNFTINGTQIAKNYAKFREILKNYPIYRKSKVVGPAIGSPFSRQFKEFLLAGGGKFVDAVTFHHYYGDGRNAPLSEFMNPSILDQLKPVIEKAVTLVKKYSVGMKKPQVWLGETATMYHGGTYGISDSYAAGFMWLDKLGLSAQMGLDSVIRQTFYLGNYSLLDMNTMPNPDYWLSLIFKRLVGPNVLNVKISVSGKNGNLTNFLRFYAHSNNSHITVYGMNLLNETSLLSFGSYKGNVIQYLLTPDNNNLISKYVKLNGEKLVFDGYKLPPIEGQMVPQPVRLPAKTFGFWTTYMK